MSNKSSRQITSS